MLWVAKWNWFGGRRRWAALHASLSASLEAFLGAEAGALQLGAVQSNADAWEGRRRSLMDKSEQFRIT